MLSLLAVPLAIACAGDHATEPGDTSEGSSSSADDSSSGDSTTGGAVDSTDDGSSDEGSTDDGADESSSGEPAPTPDAEEIWRASIPSGAATAVCVRPDGSVVLATSRMNGDEEEGAAALTVVSADGDVSWTTEIEAPAGGTYLHAVACAPDGSIYGAGVRGQYNTEMSPVLVRVDEGGAPSWTVTLTGPTQGGRFGGVTADADGVVVAGAWDPTPEQTESPLVARYTADGVEMWRLNGPLDGELGRFDDVVRVGDVVLAVGHTDDDNFNAHASVAAFGLDGTYRWHTRLTDRSTALHVSLDPSTTEVVVAGTRGRTWNHDQVWSMRCDATACLDVEPLVGVDIDFATFDGFAIDGLGRLVSASGGRTQAVLGDATVAWTFDAERDFVWDELRSTLALDSSGTVYTAVGQDPAILIALSPPR
jgi:hypothetical protein